MEEEKQAFFVESVDGRKFKMVIKGDLSKLTVAKIKRYLKSYGVPEEQTLSHHGVHLTDAMTGREFDLVNNSVLQLHEPGAHSGSGGVPAHKRKADSASPDRGALLAGPKRAWDSNDTNSRATASASLPRSTGDHHQQQQLHDSQELEQLQEALTIAQGENEELKKRLQQLERQLSQSKSNPANTNTNTNASSSSPAVNDPMQMATRNLNVLGQHLNLRLTFDDNLTCVIGADELFTILTTYDPPTERLYIYSTLLTKLPSSVRGNRNGGDDNSHSRTAVLQKLQEVCLEGNLLGREVCGGCIGMSLANELVVLSTSLPMRVCSEVALKETMPPFVESLTRWRELLNELLN